MGIKFNSRAGIYFLNDNSYNFVTIRYNGSKHSIISQINDLWDNLFPSRPFEYAFLGDLLTEQYAEEKNKWPSSRPLVASPSSSASSSSASQASRLNTAPKKLASARFLTRKFFQIVRMLVLQFSKPVLIAKIIAWPIDYLAMSRWLESFVYRMDDMVIIALPDRRPHRPLYRIGHRRRKLICRRKAKPY